MYLKGNISLLFLISISLTLIASNSEELRTIAVAGGSVKDFVADLLLFLSDDDDIEDFPPDKFFSLSLVPNRDSSTFDAPPTLR
jgi:hypothetical protein